MLTTKKKRFADAIKKGTKPVDAAIHAGYSEKSARQMSYKLAKDRDVIRYLDCVTSLNQKVTPKATDVTTTIAPQPDTTIEQEALSAMQKIMRDNLDSDPKLALDAAFKLATFTVRRPDSIGKKEHKNEAAKKVASRFPVMAPPPALKH